MEAAYNKTSATHYNYHRYHQHHFCCYHFCYSISYLPTPSESLWTLHCWQFGYRASSQHHASIVPENLWGTWPKLQLKLSLRLNSHFPGEPGLVSVKQRMMEVAVTTGLLEL